MAQLTRVTPKRLLTSSMIVGLLGTIGLAMRTGERTHDFKVKHGLTLTLLEPVWTRGKPETADMSLLFQMYTDLGTVVLDSKGIVRDHKYGFYPNRLDRLLAKMLKK